MQSVRMSYVCLKTLCCGEISRVRGGLHKICIKWWKYASKTIWVFIENINFTDVCVDDLMSNY